MRNAISSLSFSDPSQSYRDILSAISDIESFTYEMDFEAFRSNPMAVAAVERKLLVIGEAAVRLRGQPLREHPWRNVRGMGNWLRHQYDRIDLEMVWDTVKKDLEPLRQDVLQRLSSPMPKPPSP